jgi:hypothetical protein
MINLRGSTDQFLHSSCRYQQSSTGAKPPKILKPFTQETEEKLTKVKNLAGAEVSLPLA